MLLHISLWSVLVATSTSTLRVKVLTMPTLLHNLCTILHFTINILQFTFYILHFTIYILHFNIVPSQCLLCFIRTLYHFVVPPKHLTWNGLSQNFQKSQERCNEQKRIFLSAPMWAFFILLFFVSSFFYLISFYLFIILSDAPNDKMFQLSLWLAGWCSGVHANWTWYRISALHSSEEVCSR